MAIDQQVAQHAEFIDALIAAVGQDLFAKCLAANQRAREAELVAQSEAIWQARVGEGEAHAVKVVSASSYVFGTWDRASPMCGPVAALPEETRGKVLDARVGTKVKIGTKSLAITKAFEEGPAPPIEGKPAVANGTGKKGSKKR
jgi:hypothetical protein